MAVTLGGNPIDVAGSFPKVGDTAPDFKLVNKDLADVSLADFAGKKKSSTSCRASIPRCVRRRPRSSTTQPSATPPC